MSLSNSAENNLLLLIFNNTTWANVGDATGLRGSTVAGSFYVQLSTGTLGETSDQSTTEAAYGSYARQAVARSSAGWTVSGTAPTQAANTAAISYPACTSGSETETYFSIGRASSSTGEVLWYGALTASLAVSTGITPSFAIGACVANMD
jgi:hypothetical protein